MKKFKLLIFLMFTSTMLFAQNIVKGTVIDSNSKAPLKNAIVSVEKNAVSTTTDKNGDFLLEGLSNGEHIVSITSKGYETQNYPVNLSGKEVDLGVVFMYQEEIFNQQDLSIITLTDDELSDDTSAADNISGLLQSSRDVYYRVAAYEWGSSFYKIRGLDSENAKLQINGIEMNKLYNGRPQWSNWGGLNDVMRNQEFSNGLSTSSHTFGGVLGSTNISTRASAYRKGAKVSYASSNRSYLHRLMANYNSGLTKSNWAYSIAVSRRAANEGFQDATSYNANSFFASAEKKINDKQSINFTGIYAFNKRGKSAPHTQEVYDLKGIKYNEYWGWQNGKKRNSRFKEIQEPILMLNHYWDISEKTSLNTNIAYQFGYMGNSRLDFNGGANPSPVYYQKLPNYFLSRNSIIEAYQAEKNFEKNGQINWNSLYDANKINTANGKSAAFILYEDRNEDKQFTINSIFSTDITDKITINAKLQYTSLNSDNFAKVTDLLGGNGYLDISKFSAIGTNERQNDLNHPNRIVKKGDKFKYNYKLNSSVINAFAQGQFKYNKIDFYLATDISSTTHQREGLYKNGRFVNNSFGKSKKLNFINLGIKGGLTYKITGRHLLDFNIGLISKAPTLRNTFPNSRESNAVVEGLKSEKIISSDISYIFRSPFVTSRITGFYATIKDATNISFFFNQGELTEGFVQEITTGVDKKHLGIELGIEAKVTSTLKVKGAANLGQYTYNNNPNVYISGTELIGGKGILNLGKSNLKNYKIVSGPQKTFSVGFEYRDPDYWFFTATGNYFDQAYINVSPILRTSAFYTAADGLPIANYNHNIAKKLLKQEKFDDYFTLNLFGGKSWKISKSYKFIGFSAGISNVLNKKYKTGGFEQARYPNYELLKQDLNRPRLFGPKYWYARGTTYFLNIYYRF